ncbi:lipoate--protein ligase family protein [Stieleria sp. JC731]|nr:biotin/lipoate A/B protein ligase family protein [Stieleria sp. JC731]MCC9599620.1 lipoate--protein ligase family protein [Stieleria sp. JC731]
MVGRLLLNWSGGPAWNMAVDEAIMLSVSADAETGKQPQAVLRFYSWETPTLSLGYFQSNGDVASRFETLKRVRRSTGGGAIIHDKELTYSLTIATPAGQRGARHDLYQGVHEQIIGQLGELGISARPYRSDRSRIFDEQAFLCFQRRTDEDIIVSGYKVVGSAQRRAKRAILQHGSVMMRSSPWATELPGIADLSSKEIDREKFANGLTQRIETLCHVKFQPSELTEAELGIARRVELEKYSSDDWLDRR